MIYQPRDVYRRDLHLADTCKVEIFGVGGRTVDRAIRFGLDAISSTTPKRGKFTVAPTMSAIEIAM